MLRKLAKRCRSNSSSGMPRTAKTEMPSKGRPSSDQTCAVRLAWGGSLGRVAQPPLTTIVALGGGLLARGRLPLLMPPSAVLLPIGGIPYSFLDLLYDGPYCETQARFS